MRSLLHTSLLAMLTGPVLSAPFLVAHRGASADAPENTLPAFELAWTQGADAIEGDFYLTRDRKIVCIHDADTKRVCGRKLSVAASTLAELQTLDAGSWKDEKFAGTRLPTFAEVCATVPENRKLYVEIKCGPGIVPVLLEEIAACGLHESQLVVISFDAEVIRAVKTARPTWTANWLHSFDKKVATAPADEFPAVLRTLQAIKADGLSTNPHPGLTREQLAELAAAGFQHHVWTVNDAATARRFLDLGTRSVTTDMPAKLRHGLESEAE